MNKRVPTTKIEKKYKDKATGQEKKLTINYAKVMDRLNQFRADNPRGKTETTPTIKDDMLIFKAYVLKDKSDANSADATGHAMGKYDGSEKQFEKMETIALGRALAMLGYGASGEIASFEEMEEFAAYRDQKIDEIVDNINACQTVPELRKYYMSLDSYLSESRVIQAKDKRKEELQNANS